MRDDMTAGPHYKPPVDHLGIWSRSKLQGAGASGQVEQEGQVKEGAGAEDG